MTPNTLLSLLHCYLCTFETKVVFCLWYRSLQRADTAFQSVNNIDNNAVVLSVPVFGSLL